MDEFKACRRLREQAAYGRACWTAAAAGFSGDSYSAKVVRRAERAQEDLERALLEREAEPEARRKRVRRIEEGNEDREGMRELARSWDLAPLEATPDGLRETATDGTPRSAKAAGEKLRQSSRGSSISDS